MRDATATFDSITEQLNMYCCPRCMAVGYAPDDWELVIVDDATNLVDVVCPDCVTEHDMSSPERAEAVDQLDAMIRSIITP